MPGWMECMVWDGSRDTRSLTGQKVGMRYGQPWLPAQVELSSWGAGGLQYEEKWHPAPLPTIKEHWTSCTPSPVCQHSPQVCAPAQKIPHSRSRSQTASATPYIEQKCTPSIFPLKGISCHRFCFLIQ